MTETESKNILDMIKELIIDEEIEIFLRSSGVIIPERFIDREAIRRSIKFDRKIIKKRVAKVLTKAREDFLSHLEANGVAVRGEK